MKHAALRCVALLALVGSLAYADDLPDGEQLYQKHCEACHGGGVSKAPQMSLLEIMSPQSILRAMQSGVMQVQASAMSSREQEILAEHLAGQSLDAHAVNPAPVCSGAAAEFDVAAPPTTRGWGVDRGNQRFFPADIAGMTAAEAQDLELKWAFAFPGAVRARSQPAIAGGALYVGSQDGTLWALDKKTGCVRWTFSTVAEIRTGIVVEPWEAGAEVEPLLYFGDLIGNVYAVNAVTGELVWRDRPDDHPSLTITAAPALHDGRLYVSLSSLEVTAAADPEYACCTFRGGVAVYDAHSGEHLFTSYTIDEPPTVVGRNAIGTERIAPSGSPVWNTPALDPGRKLMFVGTGENYSSPANETSDAVLALSMEDGRIVWSQQMTPGDAWNMGCETEKRINCPPEDGPDYDFGAATIRMTTSEGRDLVLAGQKSGEIFALDPDSGEFVWRRKLGRGGIQGGVHFGMSVQGDTLYVPMSDFDGGPRWPGKAYPGMFAVDIPTGKVRWYTPSPEDVCAGREFCQPGLSAASTAIDGGVMAGGMDGVLRLYEQDSGEVLWSFDSAREYPVLGGGSGRGGSFGGGAGPVFDDGMMYVNSGYGIYFHMPGNVLLAFGLEEESAP
ncbi:outer membrane protein assembly factor BamB family protein [Haliea atlantica]